MDRFFTGLLQLFDLIVAYLVSCDILLYFLAIMVVYCLFGIVFNRVIK